VNISIKILDYQFMIIHVMYVSLLALVVTVSHSTYSMQCKCLYSYQLYMLPEMTIFIYLTYPKRSSRLVQQHAQYSQLQLEVIDLLPPMAVQWVDSVVPLVPLPLWFPAGQPP